MRKLVSCLLLFLVGCASIPEDTSPSSTSMNDKNLIHACGKVPGDGVTVCRYTEGMPMDSTLEMYLPWNYMDPTTATVRIRFRDKVLVKTVKDKYVSIPVAEIFQDKTWKKQYDGIMQILVQIKTTTNGHDKYIDLLGYTYNIVLKQGYTPLSIDDPASAFVYQCTIDYSTAGRVLFQCKQ